VTADARAHAEEAFRQGGLEAHTWSNQPGYVYGEHEHPYHKVLFCINGSIVVHTPDGAIPLSEGDRLDLPPHTPHSATVGEEGVTCMEAPQG